MTTSYLFDMEALLNALIRRDDIPSELRRTLLDIRSGKVPPEAITESLSPQNTIEGKIDNIIESVFHVKVNDIKLRNRELKYCVPRHVGMALYHYHTGRLLREIGEMWGGYHHSTVLHASNKTVPAWAENPHRFEGRKVQLALTIAKNMFTQ